MKTISKTENAKVEAGKKFETFLVSNLKNNNKKFTNSRFSKMCDTETEKNVN